MSSESQVQDTYIIRPAWAEELAQLHALERAATEMFRDTAHAWVVEDGGYDEQIYRDWFDSGLILVAEREGELAGFATAEVVDNQGFYALLCVHPAHANRGLGRRLTDAVKAWCASRGFTSLTMTTFPDVAWNAPMFERMGFRIMEDAELTPGLLELRREEVESGLPPEQRVFMTIQIESSR
jgi:GNAT superfamily N-acetyltransferase